MKILKPGEKIERPYAANFYAAIAAIRKLPPSERSAVANRTGKQP